MVIIDIIKIKAITLVTIEIIIEIDKLIKIVILIQHQILV